jgi:uncharacterized membrane protein YbhN (UPF0104 family)
MGLINPPKSIPLARQVPFSRSWLRFGLGTLISIGIISWLASNFEGRQVLLAFQTVDYFWVTVGLALVLLTLWARVRRWQVLLASKDVTGAAVWQALVLGQLFNLVLPARLGDWGRIYLITKRGYPSQLQALATLALEKLYDLSMLLILVISLFWGFSLPVWTQSGVKFSLIMSIGLFFGMVLFLLWYKRLKVKPGEITGWPWLNQLFERIAGGLAGLYQPRLLLRAGSWSLLVWFLGGLTNLALLQAFGLPASAGIAFLLLGVLMMGLAVPSAPGQIGVFEGLCLVTLTFFGVESHIALAYGVMLHIVVLLPPLSVGVWSLLGLDMGDLRKWR